MQEGQPLAESLQVFEGLFLRQLRRNEFTRDVGRAGEDEQLSRFVLIAHGQHGQMPRRARLTDVHHDRSVQLDPLSVDVFQSTFSSM